MYCAPEFNTGQMSYGMSGSHETAATYQLRGQDIAAALLMPSISNEGAIYSRIGGELGGDKEGLADMLGKYAPGLAANTDNENTGNVLYMKAAQQQSNPVIAAVHARLNQLYKNKRVA